MTASHPGSLIESAQEMLLLILIKSFKQQPGRNEEYNQEKNLQRFVHAFPFHFNKLND